MGAVLPLPLSPFPSFIKKHQLHKPLSLLHFFHSFLSNFSPQIPYIYSPSFSLCVCLHLLESTSDFQDKCTLKKWKCEEVKYREAMGLLGTWAMSEGKSTSGNLTLNIAFVGLTELNYNRVNESGTDFESGWEKHRKPLAFIAHKIRFTTSFMPWSGRVPISEGFHEFL